MVPGFSLESALSAIELMDPKMDRGLVKESGLPIEEFRAQLICRLPYELAVLQEDAPIHLTCQMMDALFGLEQAWLQGKRAFPESVLTAALCHRPDCIANEPLRCYVMATLRACQLVEAEVRMAGGVISPEEFFRNTFSACDPQDEDDDEGDLSPSTLIQALQSLQRDYAEHLDFGSKLKRLELWLSILDSLHHRRRVPCDAIDELEKVLMNQYNFQLEDDELFQRDQLAIYPSLANAYLTGCPRPQASNRIENPVGKCLEMIRNLRLIPRCMDVPFNECLRQVYTCTETWHPVVASLLHNALQRIPVLQQHTLVLEGAVTAWLGLPPFTRINVQPISALLLDALQVGCASPSLRHHQLHRLLRHLYELFRKPGLQTNLYVYDYLRWLRLLLAIEVILLGLRLEIYTSNEWAECFWALGQLYGLLGDHGRAHLATRLSRQHRQAMDDTSVYRDCRFAHRWNHLLPFLEDPLELYDAMQFDQEEPLVVDSMDVVLGQLEPDWLQLGITKEGSPLPCRYLR